MLRPIIASLCSGEEASGRRGTRAGGVYHRGIWLPLTEPVHIEGDAYTRAEGGVYTRAEGDACTRAEGGVYTRAEGDASTRAEGDASTRDGKVWSGQLARAWEEPEGGPGVGPGRVYNPWSR